MDPSDQASCDANAVSATSSSVLLRMTETMPDCRKEGISRVKLGTTLNQMTLFETIKTPGKLTNVFVPRHPDEKQ